MWVLLLILTINGHAQAHQLTTFQTQRDCEEVRGYVEVSMRKEYPDDTTLTVVCQVKSV